MFISQPHFKSVHYSDRACEGAWLWWSEQVRGIEDMLAGHGLRYVFFGLRLDFLLCWICSFVIGVEDVHVGQSLPGSQRENSWPGLHILGKTQSKLVIAPAEQIFMKKATTKKFFQIVYPQHANKLYFERELKLNECLRLVLADQVTAWLVFLSTPQ